MYRYARTCFGSLCFMLLLCCKAAIVTPPDLENPEILPPSISISHSAGYYTEDFLIELSSDSVDARICYTVDGSSPDLQNVMTDDTWLSLPVGSRLRTIEYEGSIDTTPLSSRPNDIAKIQTEPKYNQWGERPETGVNEVKKVVVIRAKAYENGVSSEEITRTFIIDSLGSSRYSFPVISISTDRPGFFDEEDGIYVPGVRYDDSEAASNEDWDRKGWTGNYYQTGDEWERPVYFEYFDINGNLQLSQKLGVRIHGGWSRRNSVKTLRLYARKEYGEKYMSYPFFATKDISRFKRILLRTAGNDFECSYIRDVVMQTLVEHHFADTQHYQPSIIFLNGEYWGIHNIRDRFDERYLESHYGTDSDDVTILEGNAVLDEGDETMCAQYQEMVNRISDGILDSFDEINTFMTVHEFLDYLIFQCYAANTDWPQNNIKYWRYHGSDISTSQGPFDGRWRWMFYDMDRAFHLWEISDENTDMIDWILVPGENKPPEWATELIRSLLQIDDIRHDFIQRTALHLDTTLNEDRVKDRINAIGILNDREIEEHMSRWSSPYGRVFWDNQLSIMRQFADSRPEMMRDHMMQYFDEIEGWDQLQIRGITTFSDLYLHGIVINSDTPGVHITADTWEGIVFTGVPVVMESAVYDMRNAVLTGSFTGLVQDEARLSFCPAGAVVVNLNQVE